MQRSVALAAAATLPPGVLKLFSEPNLGHVATVMPDGSPQVTPVWVHTDGTHIFFNTAEGRQKTRNLRRNAKVAISITDRGGGYAWATVRGRVVELIHDGAEAHIGELAKKYTGRESFQVPPGQQRVIVKVLPERVSGEGTG
jgi:PPOX class probable F420-dependent enzyme